MQLLSIATTRSSRGAPVLLPDPTSHRTTGCPLPRRTDRCVILRPPSRLPVSNNDTNPFAATILNAHADAWCMPGRSCAQEEATIERDAAAARLRAELKAQAAKGAQDLRESQKILRREADETLKSRISELTTSHRKAIDALIRKLEVRTTDPCSPVEDTSRCHRSEHPRAHL